MFFNRFTILYNMAINYRSIDIVVYNRELKTFSTCSVGYDMLPGLKAFETELWHFNIKKCNAGVTVPFILQMIISVSICDNIANVLRKKFS